MITKPTVFVLGAGVSHPYGFPLGSELLRQIKQSVASSSPATKKRFFDAGFRDPLPQLFRVGLARSLTTSIDSFLTTQRAFAGLGRFLIADILIRSENEQKLYIDDSARDIYLYLFNLLMAPTPLDFANNDVHFVTFNYDRSLEMAFVNALLSRFTIPWAEALTRLPPITHVYGSLGKLPHQSQNVDETRAYAPTADLHEVQAAAERIVLTPDQRQEAGINAAVRNAFMRAEQVIFLGFSYQEANMQRLMLKKCLRIGVPVYGSAYGMQQGEKETVRGMLPTAPNLLTMGEHQEDSVLFLKRVTTASNWKGRRLML